MRDTPGVHHREIAVMTVSTRKIEANRRNAQKSTGPKSRSGKARVSQNARRHGLRAQEIPFSNAEKCRRWRLLRKWTAYRQPQDDHQRALIERIVTAQVVLERLRFMQEEDCAENRLAARNWIEEHPEDRDRLEAMATTGLTVAIMRFSVRHESHWSRVLFQALEALDAAQAQCAQIPTKHLPPQGLTAENEDHEEPLAKCPIKATEETAEEVPEQEVAAEPAVPDRFAVVASDEEKNAAQDPFKAPESPSEVMIKPWLASRMARRLGLAAAVLALVWIAGAAPRQRAAVGPGPGRAASRASPDRAVSRIISAQDGPTTWMDRMPFNQEDGPAMELQPPTSFEDSIADMDLAQPPADDVERREWLIQFLGEPFCRKLGIYRVPDDLVLSVVIPVYNEKDTHPRDPPPGPRRADPQADHPRRRLLDRRHPRDPPASWQQSEPDLTIVFHDQNQGKGAALRTGFRTRPARSSSSRTPTSSTTRRSIPSSSSRSSRARPTSSSARGSSARRTACSTSGTRWPTSSSRCSRTCSPT